MCWIGCARSTTGMPDACTLTAGSAMPNTMASGASFCATLRDLGKRPFRETDCELFICKLLFNPIDTTSRQQHTKHTFKAPTTTLGRRLHWTAISLASRCTAVPRSEEHTSELQSLMRISYAVFCLKKKQRRT